MNINIIILLFFLASCSHWFRSFEDNIKKSNTLKTVQVDRKIICSEEPTAKKIEIYGGDQKSQKKFLDVLQSLEKQKINLSFREKTVLWVLMQSSMRPDLSSPTARIQLLSHSKSEYEYWDIFNSKNDINAMPMFKFIDLWLEKSKKSRSIFELFSLLENHFNYKTPVEFELAQFLNTFKSQIKENEVLRSFYYRGDDILTLNESLPIPPYRTLYQHYKKKLSNTSYIINKSLQPYQKNLDQEIICNYDFSLYDNSLFLIDREMVPGHFFGLIENDHSFFAMTSQRTHLTSLFNTSLYQGSSQVRGAALCSIKDEKTQNRLWLISHNSRDPGQHLHQLLKKNISPRNSSIDWKVLFSEMRYLFLLDPVRLVIESDRGTDKEIEELLKFNTPLYHAGSLGEIIGLSLKNRRFNFLNDPRSKNELLCW
jgi:hypothetical protein